MNDIITFETIFALWVFLVGLCIGSFLNVVVLRGLTGESIIFPASHCPACKNNLKWWMNIPVFSYIFLRGKCFYCKTKISPQYPMVELTAGVLFLLIYLKFGISYKTLFFIFAGSLLVAMTVTDFKERVIFDIHAYLLAAAGVLLNVLLLGFSGLLLSLKGALLGFILYEIFARSGYLLAGQRAFGEGDSLIALGIGAFFGWKLMAVSAILSIFIMAVFTFPYFLVFSYKEGRKKTVSALLTALFLIILALTVTKFDFIQTYCGSLAFTALIMAGTLYCAYQILSDMKNKKDEEKSFCMLPFGPAMAASFVIIMFFENEVKTFFAGFLGSIL